MTLGIHADVKHANDRMQDAHLQTVIEVLQSIKASEMTPMLQRIYDSEGGSELVDVLMKYLSVCPPPGFVSAVQRTLANPLASDTKAWLVGVRRVEVPERRHEISHHRPQGSVRLETGRA